MGESSKLIFCLILGVASVASCIVWIPDPGPPSVLTWPLRIGWPIVALAALGMVLKLQLRVDLAEDYLLQQWGRYRNHRDFCYNCRAAAVDGIACVELGFQNQRDQPCLVRIQLQHATSRSTLPTLEAIEFEIDCAPAAFGLAKSAFALPKRLQGKFQRFKVNLSVEYTDGRGQKLRFHDGVFLRGHTAWLELPVDVAGELPESSPPPEVRTLWKLGDPPLQSVVAVERGTDLTLE